MILKYSQATLEFGIMYSRTGDFQLTGFAESDWEGSIEDKKYTMRYIFHLGTSAISCQTKSEVWYSNPLKRIIEQP